MYIYALYMYHNVYIYMCVCLYVSIYINVHIYIYRQRSDAGKLALQKGPASGPPGLPTGIGVSSS